MNQSKRPLILIIPIILAASLVVLAIVGLKQINKPAKQTDTPSTTQSASVDQGTKHELSVRIPATGHTMPVDVYSPDCSAIDQSPVVIVSPGFQSRKEDQQDLSRALQTAGYTVFTLSPVYNAVRPNEAERRDDLQNLIAQINDPASEVHESLATCSDPSHLGLAGHSAGGGTSLLTAASTDRVKAVVGLDAVVTAPGTRTDDSLDIRNYGSKVTAPTLIFQGAVQSCNDDANQGLDLASLLGATVKATIRLPDSSHCDYLDTSLACSLLCGAVSQSNRAEVIRLTTRWFDVMLKGEEIKADEFLDTSK